MSTKTVRIIICISGFCFSAGLSSVLRADERAENKDALTLPAYQVREDITDSFGIGIGFRGDKKSKKLTRVVITSVVEGSDAEKVGLKVGDEIDSIEGRKVTDFTMDLKKGSELFSLFVDRPRGTRLKLGIVVRSVQTVTLTAVVPGPFDLHK